MIVAIVLARRETLTETSRDRRTIVKDLAKGGETVLEFSTVRGVTTTIPAKIVKGT